MSATLTGPNGKMMLGPTSLRIGQAQNNQLVVNDTSVSSNHAEIRPEGQSYSITDLGSSNGTFVNEQRLPPYASRLLNTGDTIRVGNTVFIYEMSSAYPYGATAYGGPSGQGNAPAYERTVVADSSFDAGAQQGYAVPPPPPNYTNYAPPPQQPYAPPFQPGQAGLSNYAAPVAQPPKKRRLGLWIAMVIVLLIIIAGSVGAYIYAGRSTPQKTLDTFCNDLQKADYHGAYTQLSSGFQRTDPESQFVSFFNNPDNAVTSCSYTSLVESGGKATTRLTIVYHNQKNEHDALTLIQDSKNNNDWKIDNASTGS